MNEVNKQYNNTSSQLKPVYRNGETKFVDRIGNNIDANQQNKIEKLTENNMKMYSDSNIKYENIDNLYAKRGTPGSRLNSEKYYQFLKDDIKEHGIEEPIYISNETGKIVDGNHRLQVAKELGLKNIPVLYIDSSNDIINSNSDWENRIGDLLNGGEETKITSTNERHQDEQRYNKRSNETSNQRRGRGQNNKLHQENEKIYRRSSTSSVYDGNSSLEQGSKKANTKYSKSIESVNTGSFNLDNKNRELTKDQSNFFKDVNNKTPSSNPNIKYSKAVGVSSSRISRRYGDLSNTEVDNVGEPISKGMSEWAKNSKARVDENGNVVELQDKYKRERYSML